MRNFQAIFNTVNIEGLDGWNIKRVSKRLTNWNITIEGARVITKHTATSKSCTVILVDIFVLKDRTSTIVNTFTLSEKWSIIEDWLDG